MELTDADVRLLGNVRKRSRHYRLAKGVLLFSTVATLIGTGWCAAKAASMYASGQELLKTVLAGEPHSTGYLKAWFALEAYHSFLLMAVLLAVQAVWSGMFLLSGFIQNRTDRLVLKLVGHASGYPEMK